MVRLPPLNALVVFEAAAQLESFTKAADALHVTQAAVSHQIKTLESWLGFELFRRRLGRGQSLILTEAGRVYLPRVRAALDILRAATGVVLDKRRHRVLRVATLHSFGDLWLLPRIRRFIEANPDVDLRLFAADIDSEVLMTGAVDIDIRYGEGDWSDVWCDRFLTEQVFPVCAPRLVEGSNALRAPPDLTRHRLIHDINAIDWRTWLDAAGFPDLIAERGPGFNHSHLSVRAAISGAGIVLGRGALVLDALRSGSLVKPFTFVLPSKFSYYVVSSKATLDDPVVASFRNWLTDEGSTSQEEMDELYDHPNRQ